MWKVLLAPAFLMMSPIEADAQQPIKITLHWITDSHGCKVWDSLPSPNESVTWTGPCVDGYADGKGRLSWFVNGRPYGTYEGELKGGHYDGHGMQIWPTGSRYDGEWKEDRANVTALTVQPRVKFAQGCGSTAVFRAVAVRIRSAPRSVGRPRQNESAATLPARPTPRGMCAFRRPRR